MRSIEDDLFELVFERLDQSTATNLVRTLSGDEVAFPIVSEGVREVSVESLALGPDVALADAHVRLLVYDGCMYDVELNFRLRHATAPSNAALAAALYAFAAELAEANGITTYFAGLEPAADEDTRLFSGKEKGPYYPLK